MRATPCSAHFSGAEPIVVAVRGVISRHEVVPLSEEQSHGGCGFCNALFLLLGMHVAQDTVTQQVHSNG